MIDSNIVQPDVTLTLSHDGVIQNATASTALAEESLEDWRGRPWGETIDPSVKENLASLIDNVRQSGASSCFKVTQRFPSGRELAMEYTAISLGKASGFIAIGRNVQVIADLESRLLAAQHDREQDYWKLREIETRYRLLFDTSSEAVVLVRAANLRIVEANLTATKSLGLSPGAEFYPAIPGRDKLGFETMLDKVREQGRAPGILLHIGAGGSSWSLRASIMNIESGAFFLFQLAPVGAGKAIAPTADAFSIEDMIQRLPDGFVVVDQSGVIRRANSTFLDLVQIGAESAVVGQNLRHWLARPGADANVILGLVQKHGSVRLFSTTLSGELGANTEVEISAVGSNDVKAKFIGCLIRDLTTHFGAATLDRPESLPGDLTLEKLIQKSTEGIERRTIVEALGRSSGNRTAAARQLGVSRQSLHAKLNKYGLHRAK